jgi:hypothetical protein
MVKNSGNPQEFVLKMMESKLKGNPICENILSLAKDNQVDQIETIARNLFKEKGLDFDKEFSSFKEMLGL